MLCRVFTKENAAREMIGGGRDEGVTWLFLLSRLGKKDVFLKLWIGEVSHVVIVGVISYVHQFHDCYPVSLLNAGIHARER